MSEQNVSCDAEVKYSLALRKQLIWFHFLLADSFSRAWGSFLVFSFCTTKGHRGPMPRHLEPKCPKASGDVSGAQLIAPEPSGERWRQRSPCSRHLLPAISVGLQVWVVEQEDLLTSSILSQDLGLLSTSQCPL